MKISEAPARIFYIPNEHGNARQSGPRLALAQLRGNGLIEDAEVFSFLRRLAHNSRTSVFRDLSDRVRNFKPTILLVQHPARTGLSAEAWRNLRRGLDFRMVYHEGDAYDRFRKRVPSEMRAAAAAADVSFSVGASQQIRLLRSAGAVDARWTPSVFNPNMFGLAPISGNKDVDIVMIANESSSRLPFRSIPGSGRRTELVNQLSKRFGRRFAVYGKGWSGPSARGPLDYNEQAQAIQSAWISTGWDHYTSEAKFFSDRLPIALASGTVHVTSSHPGYGEIFPSGLPFFAHESSVGAILKRVEDILAKAGEADLLNAMQQGRQFAHDHFRQDDNLVSLLNAAGAGIPLESARVAWKSATNPIETF